MLSSLLLHRGGVATGSLTLLLYLGTLACSASETRVRPEPGQQTSEPRALLLQELQLRSQAASWGRLDSTRVRFVENRSSIPGVVYYWGVYRPPRTMHVVFTAVAAQKNGVALSIRTATDWFRAVGGFVPSSAEQALRACAEAIHTTVEPRLPGARPRIYQDAGSLEPLSLSDSARALLSRRLSPATTEHTAGSGWVVRLWALRVSAIRRYQCSVDRERFSLVPTDSIPRDPTILSPHPGQPDARRR